MALEATLARGALTVALTYSCLAIRGNTGAQWHQIGHVGHRKQHFVPKFVPTWGTRGRVVRRRSARWCPPAFPSNCKHHTSRAHCDNAHHCCAKADDRGDWRGYHWSGWRQRCLCCQPSISQTEFRSHRDCHAVHSRPWRATPSTGLAECRLAADPPGSSTLSNRPYRR